MTEQFPALDDTVHTDVNENFTETDFLQREKELLGDEFKTEQDEHVLNKDKDAEIQQFEEAFPDIEKSTPAPSSTVPDDDEFGDFGQNISATDASVSTLETPKEHEPTEAIKNWKERRDLEINERDSKDTESKAQLEKEAVENINEFYENYAKKKESKMAQALKEAQDFLAERDSFFTQEGTTTWDRALQLINTDDAEVVAGRDRSKFKEILLKLKGNEKAPGASGY